MSVRDFFLRPSEPLSTGTLPGTRKVNNFPLILGMGVLAVFIGIVGLVMHNRANQAAVRKQEEPQKGDGSTQFAAEVTAPWNTGFVQPAAQPAPAVEPSPSTPSERSTVPALPALPRSTGSPKLAPDPWAMERERVHSARMQAYEAALKSRTGVQVTQRGGPSQSAADVRQRLDATRQQLAGMGNDPMAVYQARLSSLSGQSGASGQSDGLSALSGEGRSAQPAFSRDNWTLENEVASPAPFTLQAGFVIPATMISGITSNLPGQVMAQVSQNVFDSPSGRHLLIPQGTRLIGTYNSDVAYGQERVLMAWQRLLFPDGRTLNIQAMPGADNAGNAGFTDKVNNHYFRTFSSAFLLSGVIAATSMSQDSGKSTGDRQRASDALSESLGQTLGTTMAEMIRKNLNIAPTLHIRPGYRFNVMVTKDMVFPGAYGIL